MQICKNVSVHTYKTATRRDFVAVSSAHGNDAVSVFVEHVHVFGRLFLYWGFDLLNRRFRSVFKIKNSQLRFAVKFPETAAALIAVKSVAVLFVFDKLYDFLASANFAFIAFKNHNSSYSAISSPFL